MKKSEFKSLIKEAMMEILPELMEIMADNLNESYVPQTVRQEPDMTLVRSSHIQQEGGYDDMPTGPRLSAPKNPKTIIEGETFVSGKNIMEWVRTQKVGSKPSEFNHTPNQMEDYMSKKFGV